MVDDEISKVNFSFTPSCLYFHKGCQTVSGQEVIPAIVFSIVFRPVNPSAIYSRTSADLGPHDRIFSSLSEPQVFKIPRSPLSFIFSASPSCSLFAFYYQYGLALLSKRCRTGNSATTLAASGFLSSDVPIFSTAPATTARLRPCLVLAARHILLVPPRPHHSGGGIIGTAVYKSMLTSRHVDILMMFILDNAALEHLESGHLIRRRAYADLKSQDLPPSSEERYRRLGQ